MTGEELFLNELNFHIRQGISKKDLTDLINERLKQLTIPVVVGQSEQLFCGDLIKHNFSLSKIGRCIICDREKDKAK